MDIMTVLIALGVLIFSAHIFGALFEKTRVPSVLLLILIGLVAGPVLHWMTPAYLGEFGRVFTTLTLITILFESGTNLRLDDLKASVLGASALTLLNFVFALGIGWAAGMYLLNLSYLHSLFLGAAIGGTSSAVVIPMLKQLKLGKKAGTALFMESALSDILCLIVALALLGGIETGEISILGIFGQMGVSLVFAVLIGVGFGIGWTLLLKKFLSGIKNSMFTTFAFAFILYGVTEKLGLNGGICILAFGMTVGNIGSSPFFRRFFKEEEDPMLNQEEKNFYSEIVFIMQTYFFVFIGLSIQFNDVWHLLVGGGMVALTFGFRYFSGKTLGKEGVDLRDRSLVTALGPKGLVAAVLASLPLQNAESGLGAALMSGNEQLILAAQSNLDAGVVIQNVAYGIVLISIVLSSVLVFVIERKRGVEAVE